MIGSVLGEKKLIGEGVVKSGSVFHSLREKVREEERRKGSMTPKNGN